MKKLLLLPLLLLAFMVKAQLPVLRAPDGVTVEDTRLYVLKNLRVPVFTDSTAANVAKGLDSVGTLFFKRGTRFVFVRTVDANGTHKWDTLGGVSGSGGGSGDTVFLYQIGTAAGQIETLYAVDGNLRKSRWVPGYGTLPFLAPDSAAYIDIDTTSIAYKSWVISLFGTSINNLQQVIDNGNHITRTDTIMGNDAYDFTFDSLNNFRVKGQGDAVFGGDGRLQSVQLYGLGFSSEVIVQNRSIIEAVASTPFVIARKDIYPDSIFERMTNSGTGYQSGYKTVTDSITIVSNNGTDSIKFSVTPITARLKGLPHSNDTTARKPVAIGTDGSMVVMDGWAGSGGGGSSNAVGRDSVVTITSGTSSTVTDGYNIVRFNSTGVLTYTLTLPTTWHTSNDLLIAFTSNGTITNGNLMVNLTIVAGSGHTLSYVVNPTASYNAGEVLRFHLISTIEQRTN